MQSEENKNNNLKKLRKDKGLSIESVSGSLKLTTDVIRKLEASEFESLGAYTYVRGYLSHYAKLLGVEAQQFIDLIPKSSKEIPLINTNSNNNKSFKLKKHSKNFINYAVGTFVVVAISFSGYYLLKNYTKNTNNIEIVEKDTLEIRPKEQNIPITDNRESTAEDQAFHYSSIIPTENSPTGKVTDDRIEIPVKNNSLNENGNLDSDLNEKDEGIPQYSYNIIIEAEETSWVKVEHEDGNKLHNDLLKPGTISLNSDKPVHFRIGNEKKVKVTINGEQINLSEFSRKDIADFNWPIES